MVLQICLIWQKKNPTLKVQLLEIWNVQPLLMAFMNKEN